MPDIQVAARAATINRSSSVNCLGEPIEREMFANGYTFSVVTDMLGYHCGFWFADEKGEYGRCDTIEAVEEWRAEVAALPMGMSSE